MTIGIVGLGYVGTACVAGFENKNQIYHYDKDQNKNPNCSSIAELVSNTRTIFVCVPTPSKRSGECDTSIVESVVDEISLHAKTQQRSMEIVIKSTIPPGTTERLQEKHPHVLFIFNPEFLTEANYIKDFKEQKYIILGFGKFWLENATFTEAVYKSSFPDVPQIHTMSKEAEMVKYVTNTFLSLKVIFANQIKSLCNSSLDINYEQVVEMIKMDDRMGTTHWKVPGPDGKPGFGGSCFPKDIQALLKVAEEQNKSLSVLRTAWGENLVIRPQKDWEQLKGRAVSDS